MSPTDRRQAHYFDELLGCRRAELDQRIAGLSAQVLKMAHIGDQAGVGRAQRVIRALERDVRSIGRMREALRLRLEILRIGA